MKNKRSQPENSKFQNHIRGQSSDNPTKLILKPRISEQKQKKICIMEPKTTKDIKKFEFPSYLQNLTSKARDKEKEKTQLLVKNEINEEINRLKKHFLHRQV